MSQQKTASSGGASDAMKSTFAMITIPILLIVSILIYKFVMGNPSNFEGGDPKGHPLPGNFLGIIYKGGFIVPILITCLLTTIVMTIERFITIGKAGGKGSVADFVVKVRNMIRGNDIDKALKECDAQQGVVANVVKAGLMKFKEMEANNVLDNEKKELGIAKDIEEATSLEMPMLEKNLTILATLASISTLLGLLGTVLGMIRAFAALANTGAPDTSALATGISEALINTAFGIGTSMLAIVFYNYFTSKIDSLTYGIDEAGFSIIQTFASKNH